MTDTLTFPVNQGLTAETPSRTIAGVVLPWDSPGRTSAGELRAVPGSIRLPADLSRVKLYGSGHDRETPVAYCTGAQVTAEGLHLTFKVAPTPAGDQALAEALARVRDAFSVELDDLELDGDRLIGGRLTGVALVTVPAFPDARITQVAAAAVPPEVTAMPTMTQVMNELAKKTGGAAAKGAETAAGKMKIATNSMNEAQESIGAGLLPVMLGCAATSITAAGCNVGALRTSASATQVAWIATT